MSGEISRCGRLREARDGFNLDFQTLASRCKDSRVSALNGWYSPKIGVGSKVFYYRISKNRRFKRSEWDLGRWSNG